MVAARQDRGQDASLTVMVSDVGDQYAETLRILLEPHGFIIHRVGSGADAIWLVEQHAVDAAVLDAELPDMPGVRAMRVIRSLDVMIPIILVGRSTEPDDQEHLLRSALELEAFSVLAEPVDLEVLLGQMARLFERFLASSGSADRPTGPKGAGRAERLGDKQSGRPSGRRIFWFGRRV